MKKKLTLEKIKVTKLEKLHSIKGGNIQGKTETTITLSRNFDCADGNDGVDLWS